MNIQFNRKQKKSMEEMSVKLGVSQSIFLKMALSLLIKVKTVK